MTENSHIQVLLFFLGLLLLCVGIFGLVQLAYGEYGEIQPDGISIKALWHFNGDVLVFSGYDTTENFPTAYLTVT